MTNICGHERTTLLRALVIKTEQDNDIKAPLRCLPMPLYEAYKAVEDFAKLAEMLAHEGRRLGLSIAIYDNHRRFRMSGAPVAYALLIVADGFSIQDRDKRGWDFDMSQIRALLLKWLNLPDGAREEAERVLRGSNADPTKLGP